MTLGDVVGLDINEVAVDPNGEYHLAGVLIAGRGLFWRGRIRGRETNYPTLHRLRAGQLVMRKLTAWEGPITTVTPEFDGGYVSGEFPTFTLDQSRLLPEYMRIVCQWPPFHAEMRIRSTGTAERRNRLKAGDLLSIRIALPSLDEQLAIAETVAKVDECLAASQEERRAGMAVLRAAREALIVPRGAWEALPEGWALRLLGEVTDVRSGLTKGRKTRGRLQSAPFLRAANVQDGFLDLTEMKRIDVTVEEQERFLLEQGDLLMIEGGNAEHLGRGWIWNDEVGGCLHQNHVFRARPNVEEVEPRFLAYAVATSPARAYCSDMAKKTTNLASINKKQVSALPVALPSLDEQRAIVAKLDAIRSAAIGAHHVGERLQGLRSSLVNALLSGDRRVSVGAELVRV